MPTYEYRCPEGHDFEKFYQKMSNAQSELPCPTCGLVAARRVSAGGGLLFKGSGFYITDYGKDGKKDQRTAAKGDTGSSKSEGGGVSSAASGEKSAGGEKPSKGETPAGGEKSSAGEKSATPAPKPAAASEVKAPSGGKGPSKPGPAT
jgi:putative FmdB family regulatory protein